MLEETHTSWTKIRHHSEPLPFPCSPWTSLRHLELTNALSLRASGAVKHLMEVPAIQSCVFIPSSVVDVNVLAVNGLSKVSHPEFDLLKVQNDHQRLIGCVL